MEDNGADPELVELLRQHLGLGQHNDGDEEVPSETGTVHPIPMR